MSQKPVVPERARDYLYPIVLAAIPLLTAWGKVSESEGPLWAALAAAVLGVGTATTYRPSKTINRDDE